MKKFNLPVLCLRFPCTSPDYSNNPQFDTWLTLTVMEELDTIIVDQRTGGSIWNNHHVLSNFRKRPNQYLDERFTEALLPIHEFLNPDPKPKFSTTQGRIPGIGFAVSNDGGKTGVAWRENVFDALDYQRLQNSAGAEYAVVAVPVRPEKRDDSEAYSRGYQKGLSYPEGTLVHRECPYPGDTPECADYVAGFDAGFVDRRKGTKEL